MANKPTQHAAAFSRGSLLGRMFRAAQIICVPTTEAKFTPTLAILMLRAVRYFSEQQEGTVLPGITSGAVLSVFTQIHLCSHNCIYGRT